jgi:hypothetical protein
MAKDLHMVLAHGHRFVMPPVSVSRWVSIEGDVNTVPRRNAGMLRFDAEPFGHVTVLIE